MIGRRLAHYRIDAPLGEGGMGVVYRARDLHLERDVAIKVLPPGALSDPAASRHFRREALKLSRLNHPHIATVHDFDTQDGIDFMVMELVPGQPLSQRIASGALGERELVEIASQIADALEAAHRSHIVHRDLKPGNVIVTPDGRVKVLDFGLASVTRTTDSTPLTRSMTEPDLIAGTLHYMAPEQLLGGTVDGRADLYALGVVMYEMATGNSPYRATLGTALVHEIINEPIESPRRHMPGLSQELEAIILRCLEKAPGDRFATATDVEQALRTAGNPASSPRSVAGSGVRAAGRRRASRVGLALGVAAILGVVAFVIYQAARPGGRAGGHGPPHTLAVLPLENLSRDPEQAFFSDGMTQELTTALSRISGLTVIAAGSARTASEHHLALPELGRRLQVRLLVQGAVARAGERIRINASLVEAVSGQVRWSNSYTRDVRNVLELQSEVAMAIANEIQVRLTAGERVRLAPPTRPVDPLAHEQYLHGLHSMARPTAQDLEQAIEHFRQAAEIDPDYAAPHAAMASAYFRLSTWWIPPRVAMPKAGEAADRALELDPSMAEAHAIKGILLGQHEWRFADAVTEGEHAVALNPGSAEAHFFLGYSLLQIGRFTDSRTHFMRAVQLDPLNSYYRWNATTPLFYSGRYPETIQELEALIGDDPQFANAFVLLGESHEQLRQYPQSLSRLEHARALGIHAWGLAAIGRVYARMGRPDSAQAFIRQLENPAASLGAYVSPYGTATIWAALGDKDRAFALLDRAIAERSEDLGLLKIDPRIAPLRSDPRLRSLLIRAGHQ